MDQKCFIIEKQRVDKWLWHARFFKTRSIASKIIKSGKVFLDDNKITKTHAMLSFGSRLIFTQGRNRREVEVISMVNNRVSAKESIKLYNELLNLEVVKKQSQKNTKFVDRKIGLGRPTKKNRREIDKLTNKNI